MLMLAAADAWKRPMLYISMRSSRTMSWFPAYGEKKVIS